MFDQSFEIQSTLKQNVFVSTTGISEEEKRLIKSHLPKHIILEDVLSSNTNYLVTYKAMMNDKYIQALKWNIKILNVRWLYDTDSNARRYEMIPFEGMSFTTSEISSDILINYHCLLGACMMKNLGISTDFLITDLEMNEKIEFCMKYDIPIVKSQGVFGNDYDMYRKESRFEVMDMNDGPVFHETVFFLDPGLPKVLFNCLRRLIIENGGTRVSSIDKDVDLILMFSNEIPDEYSEKIYHYQYVFDCVESEAMLFPGSYRVYPKRIKPVLDNVVCHVDFRLGENRDPVRNKLKALGAIMKTHGDMSCTHVIVKNKKGCRRGGPYKVVTSEWVDQCLYVLRHVREDKYQVRTEDHDLFRKNDEKMKRIKNIKPMIFQFTGLSLNLRSRAIERFEEMNIKYSDADGYDSCTHLIMGAVSTSEKLLSCLCNGGWILRPSVIDEFDNSPDFDFSMYEWTTDENTSEKNRKVVLSIRKWRERVSATGKPAFYKWIVRLYCDDKRRDGYVRVIESGGGVITTDDDYTYCFVSKSYEGDVPVETHYSTDYIFSYLFQ